MLSINDLNKTMDFNLPEGYFEEMQDEVFTKIHRYEKRVKQHRIFYSIGAVAASLFIVFSIVYFSPNENSVNLVSLLPEGDELHSIYDNVIEDDLTTIEENNQEVAVFPSKKISLKQMIAKIELDNLDYDIIEHYEEAMYDIAFLDLYY